MDAEKLQKALFNAMKKYSDGHMEYFSPSGDEDSVILDGHYDLKEIVKLTIEEMDK